MARWWFVLFVVLGLFALHELISLRRRHRAKLDESPAPRRPDTLRVRSLSDLMWADTTRCYSDDTAFVDDDGLYMFSSAPPDGREVAEAKAGLRVISHVRGSWVRVGSPKKGQ